MDHELSDAHKLIRDTARPVARERVGPRAAIQIEAARHLVYDAASLVDQGRHDRQHAARLPMAETLATQMTSWVTSDALQILGAKVA